MFVHFFPYKYTEIDTEGTIPPDDDPPQEMGDSSVDVTEEMLEKSQEERSNAMMAVANGNQPVMDGYWKSYALNNACTIANFCGNNMNRSKSCTRPLSWDLILPFGKPCSMCQALLE